MVHYVILVYFGEFGLSWVIGSLCNSGLFWRIWVDLGDWFIM